MSSMKGPTPINRIPALDQLINEKLDQIADCIARERGMAKFSTLSDEQQDTLLDDAFEMVNEWNEKERAFITESEMQILLRQHHDLTQEMKSIHDEVDKLSKRVYYGD